MVFPSTVLISALQAENLGGYDLAGVHVGVRAAMELK